MAAKQLTISIPEYQALFLDENPDFSPSKLLQSKLNELMETSKDWTEQIKAANAKTLRVIETLNKQRDFIEAKGLMDEFIDS
jgi:hypothetical protein